MPQPRVRRYAPIGLGLAGLAVVLGSLGIWAGACPLTCDLGCFFPAPTRSGLDMGPGVATAVIGALLAAAGIGAARRGGVSAFRPEAINLAVLAILISLGYAVVASWTYDLTLSVEAMLLWAEHPFPGLHWVVVGGTLAVVAAFRLHRPDTATRDWALARLPATTLLSLGVTFWLAALMRRFPVQAEGLFLAMVPVALGLAIWPGRPRLFPYPRLAASGLVLCSGLALALAVADPSLIWLLRLAPLTALAPFALRAVARHLPPLDPPLLSETGQSWRDQALEAIGSGRFLLGSALALTAITVGLLVVRLVASEPLEFLALCSIVSSRFAGLLVLIGLGAVTLATITLAAKRM